MSWSVTLSGAACGATITGLDLSRNLDPGALAALRELWLSHHVLVFPGQSLTDEDLERITLGFGDFSDDPFIEPIEGHKHVIAVERRADETGPIFAEAWHSDWSFLPTPPDGTLLYGIAIPPNGGDTLFANQQLAWTSMPADLQRQYQEVVAVHSARRAYAPDGFYGEKDSDRSMVIRPSTAAEAVHRHLLVRPHPETGVPGFFGCEGYIVGLEGNDMLSDTALQDLLRWQTQEQFVYRHRWEPGMLVIWDNRSVLHQATGGYDGYHRLLHRTTIGARAMSQGE